MISEIVLMIILTVGENDPVDASLIEVESVAECEERSAAAKAVFPQAGIEYISHHCVASSAEFEYFPHNAEPTGPKYYYDLTFSADKAALIGVTLYPSMAACSEKAKGTCVVTYQKRIK